jgi:hypothetical protein
MAEALGLRPDEVRPADALTWYLESLPKDAFEETVTEIEGPPDPDAPHLTGDPVFDAMELAAVEKRKRNRLTEA